MSRRRNVQGSLKHNFRKQLAEQSADQEDARKTKFRATAAPKGTKLAAGYQDRTQNRIDAAEDDKFKRVKALEEMAKLGQIDEGTFRTLRDEITGGQIANVHLIKGLDFNLLRRVRDGEDVFVEEGAKSMKPEEDTEEAGNAVDESALDAELAEVLKQDIQTLPRQEHEKNSLPSGGAVAGQKRSRSEILDQWKASRQAAKAPELVPLSSKFRKVGSVQDRSRIERDSSGREVIVLVQADGTVKRKVRKTMRTGQDDRGSGTDQTTASAQLLIPAAGAVPIGMKVPEWGKRIAETKLDTTVADMDIFDGVGADFDPLGVAQDDHSSAEETSTGDLRYQETRDKERNNVETRADDTVSHRHDYFQSMKAKSSLVDTTNSGEGASRLSNDPDILAALRKAATIQSNGKLGMTGDGSPDDRERALRHKAMIDNYDRDAEDMDLGFGGDRRADGDEQAEDSKTGRPVKLSVWGEEERQEKHDGRRGQKATKKNSAVAEAKKAKRQSEQKKRGQAKEAEEVLRVLQRRSGK